MLNQPDEHFIEVVSNASMDIFPENNLSKFSNRLHHPIILDGNWTVGLQEIFYPSGVLTSQWSINIEFHYAGKMIRNTATINGSDKISDIVNNLNSSFRRAYLKISEATAPPEQKTNIDLDLMIENLLKKSKDEILQLEPGSIKVVYGALIRRIKQQMEEIGVDIVKIENQIKAEPDLQVIKQQEENIKKLRQRLTVEKNKISELINLANVYDDAITGLKKRKQENEEDLAEKTKILKEKLKRIKEIEGKKSQTEDEQIELEELKEQKRVMSKDIKYMQSNLGLTEKNYTGETIPQGIAEFEQLIKNTKQDMLEKRQEMKKIKDEIEEAKKAIESSKKGYKKGTAVQEENKKRKKDKQKSLKNLTENIKKIFEINKEDSRPPEISITANKVAIKRGIHKFLYIIPKFEDASMYSLLGLPEEWSVTALLNDSGEAYSVSEANLNLRSYLLFVYSDIVAEHFVGNGNARVLRVLPMKKDIQSELIHEIFTKPHYYPIRSNKIEDINVILADETGNSVKFASGRVLLGLHLRRE